MSFIHKHTQTGMQVHMHVCVCVYFFLRKTEVWLKLLAILDPGSQ